MPKTCPGCECPDEPLAINVPKHGYFAICFYCRWTHTEPRFTDTAEAATAAFYEAPGRSGHQSPGLRAKANAHAREVSANA